MTRDDILNMVQEAWTGSLEVPFFERFAALVAAVEREWQGLTDKEIDKLFGKAGTSIYYAERQRKRDLEIYAFGARDAEAALKEKNRE